MEQQQPCAVRWVTVQEREEEEKAQDAKWQRELDAFRASHPYYDRVFKARSSETKELWLQHCVIDVCQRCLTPSEFAASESDLLIWVHANGTIQTNPDKRHFNVQFTRMPVGGFRWPVFCLRLGDAGLEVPDMRFDSPSSLIIKVTGPRSVEIRDAAVKKFVVYITFSAATLARVTGDGVGQLDDQDQLDEEAFQDAMAEASYEASLYAYEHAGDWDEPDEPDDLKEKT
jgi:hypothetical protein